MVSRSYEIHLADIAMLADCWDVNLGQMGQLVHLLPKHLRHQGWQGCLLESTGGVGVTMKW